MDPLAMLSGTTTIKHLRGCTDAEPEPCGRKVCLGDEAGESRCRAIGSDGGCTTWCSIGPKREFSSGSMGQVTLVELRDRASGAFSMIDCSGTLGSVRPVAFVAAAVGFKGGGMKGFSPRSHLS